ncbi:MAG: hypothetical protein K9J13_07750 [Saprospiraceae bacterium]|nr:hypothetical protein [Saprospiraceae bacterium]
MKQILFILTVIILTSCDFKSSADYNSEAEKLEQDGKYKEAISLLNKALEKDPRNIYALINRGVDKSILEDYRGAIIDYSTIIEIDSANTLAYLNRGKNKKRLDDFQGAIEDFEKAIKTKGCEQIYFNSVENSFVETGFEFDVKMEEIRYERGIARYYIDSLQTAFKDFDFCIQKNFELSESYYWRGVIYLAYDMKTEACEDLKISSELGDKNAIELMEKYCK